MNQDWFGGRLRELREQAGLNRQELADRAGLKSAAGIRNLEQGIVYPSWPMVLALWGALPGNPHAFAQPPADLPPLKSGQPRKASTEANGQSANEAPKKTTKTEA